jgi:hypothetical protein
VLARLDDAPARTIASRLVALRPHLDYDSEPAAATAAETVPALAMQGA